MAEPTMPGRRRQVSPIVPVFVAFLIGGVLFFFVASSGRGGDDPAPPTSTTTSAPTSTPETPPPTDPPPDPVPAATIAVEPFPEDPPDTYRITYDVIENGLERTETVLVDRPFRSLVLSTRDGELVSGTATSTDRLWTYLSGRDGWLMVQPELHRAAFDHRPLAAMATMVALGLAEELEPDSVLDRECRVFRTGGPLSDPGARAPTEGESTEACIDGNGLVLHERWEISGQVVTERTATAVEIDVDVSEVPFDPTPVIDDAEEFEALLSTIAVPADEETLSRLRTDLVPPDGFDLVGTVLRAAGAGSPGADATEVVRFYTDGTDLLEVAELTTQTGADLSSGGAFPVEIDGPETWFLPDFRASVMRTRLSETALVELRGTNPAQLVALLDTLTYR